MLVDGSGREAHGRIAAAKRGETEVAVERVMAAEPDALPPIHLCVAAVRSERLSWIAEKAAELGAASLRLVVTDRTQRQRAAADIVARLRRVVEEAAEQSDSARWPQVEGPLAFAAALADDDTNAMQRFLLDPRGEAFPSHLPARPTALLVGPEGGWTEDEHAAALAAGWVAASLPAGKLRAETAAVAGLALARAALARGSH